MTRSADLLYQVYVHRLLSLAQSIVSGCDRIFTAAPIPATGGYIQVSPELHADIDGVLVNAANLKKLITTPPARGSSESARTFRFRRSRTEALAQLVRELDIDVIADAQVRNSLEHFDEYLDKLGGRLADGEPPPDPIAAFNIALSSWAVVDALERGRMYPIRVYVADERTFYNFGRQINLEKLRYEAAAITEHLLASDLFSEGEAHGGMMLIFPRS